MCVDLASVTFFMCTLCRALTTQAQRLEAIKQKRRQASQPIDPVSFITAAFGYAGVEGPYSLLNIGTAHQVTTKSRVSFLP